MTVVKEKSKKLAHARKERHSGVKHQKQGRDLGGE